MNLMKELYIFVLILNTCAANAGYVINNKKFPDNFMFGVASSSYQTEGAWNEDGKTENIFDNITHRRSDFIMDGTNGDVACDFYHKYKEDVALLKSLGVNHFRLSLSWNRILPNGIADKVNPLGVAYYKNLLKELKDNGIKPLVTIFHWDLPQVLLDQGGFLNDSIIDWFGDYARVCFESFGDDVQYWITINEPKQVCIGGYGYGFFPPMVKSQGLLEYECNHNVIKAHARAWHIYDKEFRSKQGGKIGITFDAPATVPASETPGDKEAAERRYHFEIGIYANPMYHGDYPEIVKTRVAERSKLEGRQKSRLPEFTDAEKVWLKGTVDFFALSTYSGNLARAIPEPPVKYPPSRDGDQGVEIFRPDTWNSTVSMNVKVVPWTIRYLLRFVKEHYNDPDILITENGFPDDGGLNDDGRISYIREYLSHIRDAMIEDKVKVLGYTVWSFIDSLEWMTGYRIKYGLFRVDFNSPNRTRTPKLSAKFYQKVCKTKCLSDVCED
ncbi:myrosinase 1 isoform X1 [Leptinotarsa decemlineata]|uniref:myrosinase 1 isoform X1 n=1 Tax=Leptinotarsa decemlineata TaxID=7539 RepID=UPI003D308D64